MVLEVAVMKIKREFRSLLAEFFAEPTVAEHFEAVTPDRDLEVRAPARAA